MPAIVNGYVKGSVAQEVGLDKGDEILSIDGNSMSDLIDYNFLCKSELLTIEIKKKDGTIEEIEIEKDYDEDLGIIFESAVFDRIKPCLNHCIFCFVNQQPKGLRDSLYVKDDDYRLSYLQGTYITLTNLTDKDKERIKKMHLGPFYISVHTTNPELRVKMLGNPNAGKALENLQWLRKNKIPFHAQIVLCPGYNDGKELERTLSDLEKLKRTLLSVAIVPVGITQYRKNSNLKPVDKICAKETIKIASKFKKVCCSDELFLTANENIPPKKYYGNFSQLDDGVGALRYFLEDFKRIKKPKSISKPLNVLFATSIAASSAIYEVSEQLNKIKNLKTSVSVVKSEYWGENITVAGLITSDDLIKTVKGRTADIVVIPSVMLRPFSEVFLDGKTLEDVKRETKMKFFVVKNQYSIAEFVEYINNF